MYYFQKKSHVLNCKIVSLFFVNKIKIKLTFGEKMPFSTISNSKKPET